MANNKDIKTTASNVFDVFVDYAVEEQIKASDVPPRQKLDISFSDASKIGDKKSETNQEAYEKAHGKLYNMTHNNTIPWRNYVVYIILLTMLSCCFTFSRYISTATGGTSVSVAKFNVVTTGSLDGSNFTIQPVTDGKPNSTIYVKESDDPKPITLKISSTSEVPVKVTVTQTNTTFGNSFKDNINTVTIDMTDGSTSKDGTVTFVLTPSSLDTSGLTEDADGYYNMGNLTFNVYIEQVD